MNIIIREMKVEDLKEVADIHRKCFPPSLSIFSALPEKVVCNFYKQFIVEKESVAVVLADEDSGRIGGYAAGTFKLGIHRRFVKKNIFMFSISVLRNFFSNKTVRRIITANLCVKKESSCLKNADIPMPQGPVALFMPIAIHPAFRGGGNALRLAEFLTKKFFDMGAVRVRGNGITVDNIASQKLFTRLGWKMKKVSDRWYAQWIDRSDMTQ